MAKISRHIKFFGLNIQIITWIDEKEIEKSPPTECDYWECSTKYHRNGWAALQSSAWGAINRWFCSEAHYDIVRNQNAAIGSGEPENAKTKI